MDNGVTKSCYECRMIYKRLASGKRLLEHIEEYRNYSAHEKKHLIKSIIAILSEIATKEDVYCTCATSPKPQ